MEDKVIQDMIVSLQEKNCNEEAIFSFYNNGNYSNEECIKGNRQGLELFALELLKISMKIDGSNYHKIEASWVSVNNEFDFRVIEIGNDETHTEETFAARNTLLKLSVVVIFLVIATVFAIGVATLIYLWQNLT